MLSTLSTAIIAVKGHRIAINPSMGASKHLLQSATAVNIAYNMCLGGTLLRVLFLHCGATQRRSPRQCKNAFKAKLKFRRGNKLKLSSVCRLYSTRPSSDRAIFVKLPQGAIRYFENSTPIAIATATRGRTAGDRRHTGEAMLAT